MPVSGELYPHNEEDNMSQPNRLTAISLFASAGIGDLALAAAGADVLVASELVSSRAALFRSNFPDCIMVEGDILETADRVVDAAKLSLAGRELDILFATPPCQGMSKNGRGKLLRGVRDGLREALDPRNQLATSVPPIAARLSPKVIVFENVPEMDGTLIANESGELEELLAYLARQLPDYLGAWHVVEFADFGVPQRRQRLLTVFVRLDILKAANPPSESRLASWIFPEATHSRQPTLTTEAWVSVEDAIGHLPPLDAGCSRTATSDIPYHFVSLLDEKKYWWVSRTRPGTSAFDNQCANPECGFDGNPTHSAKRNSQGINQAATSTPSHCLKCGQLLPRPVVESEDGTPRIMRGFTSAYKRMRGDLPSPAMTRNLSFVSSDQKVHPTQNRALSLYEAMVLHTITDYPYRWQLPDGRAASAGLVRDAIGESIPPRGLQVIFDHVFARLGLLSPAPVA